MKTFQIIFLLLLAVSCSTTKSSFDAQKVCSNESVRYLKNPRNLQKQTKVSSHLERKIASTKRSMQMCYEDFKNRSGYDEDFNTCLVVGVNGNGQMDFYNFSSKQAKLDKKFMNCAASVMGTINFTNYGSNYLLVQSYQFYSE